MAIAQQLQAEGASHTDSGSTESVTLSAGSNRYMVVALVTEHASAAAAPTSVTYGGNALALITDGTVTASQTSTLGGVFMYRLLEANMPSNGAQNLIVSWPSSTNYVMGWWILTGVEQANADDVKTLAQTTTATSITVTLDAGNTTDAVICASYANLTSGSTEITISGASLTEDFNTVIASTAIGAAGTDLPSVASGTIACVATSASNNRRIIVAIRIAEAATPVDVGGSLTMGKPTLNAAPGGGIVEQLHAVSSVQTGADPSFSVTLGAGSDRMMVVLIVAPYDEAAFLGVTYGGNALAHATNGTIDTVLNDSTGFNSVQFLVLYEADMPANGSNTLAIDTAGAGTEGYFIAWWILENVDQSANVIDVATATSGSSPLSLSSFAATAADQMVFAAAAGVFGFTGTTLTIDGNGITQVTVDNDPPSSFETYWKAGHADTTGSGAVTVTSTLTGTPGTNILVGFILGTTGAGGGHVTVEDAAFVDAGGSLTMSKPTISGTATVEVVASGSLTMGKPTLSGTASPEVVASGSLTMGKPTLSASASPEVAVSGSLAMGAPTLSGTALVEVVAGGSLDMSKPTLSGTVTLVVEINAGGSMTVGKPTLDGSATVEVVAGGSLAMPVPTLSGSASPEVVAGGSLSMSVPTLAGSASIPDVADVGGSLTLGKPTLSGAVTIAVTAGGSLVMGKPTLDGRVVDPNATEPRPGVFVTVVVPHGALDFHPPEGAAVVVRAYGGQESKSPSGGVTVRRPRGGVS